MPIPSLVSLPTAQRSWLQSISFLCWRQSPPCAGQASPISISARKDTQLSCNRVMPMKSPTQERAESWRGKAGKSPTLRLAGGTSALLDPQQDALTHTLYLPGTNLLKVRGKSAAARQADKSPGAACSNLLGSSVPAPLSALDASGCPKPAVLPSPQVQAPLPVSC